MALAHGGPQRLAGGRGRGLLTLTLTLTAHGVTQSLPGGSPAGKLHQTPGEYSDRWAEDRQWAMKPRWKAYLKRERGAPTSVYRMRALWARFLSRVLVGDI